MDLVPFVVFEEETDRECQHQRSRRRHRPRLLRPDQPFRNDFLRQQIRVQLGKPQPLQAEPVADGKRRQILFELRRCQHRLAGHPSTPSLLFDVNQRVPEVLRQVLLQPRQFHRVAQGDDPADLSAPVNVLEKADRTLNLGQKIIENRPHGLNDRLGVLGLTDVALQMLGFGKRQLQLFGQLLGKMVTPQRNASLPNAKAVGDHQIRRVRSDVQNHIRVGRTVGVVDVVFQGLGQ